MLVCRREVSQVRDIVFFRVRRPPRSPQGQTSTAYSVYERTCLIHPFSFNKSSPTQPRRLPPPSSTSISLLAYSIRSHSLSHHQHTQGACPPPLPQVPVYFLISPFGIHSVTTNTPVFLTHFRSYATVLALVCPLLLEKKTT